jgi:hypothetical protein
MRMTVGKMKALLADVPDDLLLYEYNEDEECGGTPVRIDVIDAGSFGYCKGDSPTGRFGDKLPDDTRIAVLVSDCHITDFTVEAVNDGPDPSPDECAHADGLDFDRAERTDDALIVHVNCRTCGQSGSYTLDASEVLW